MSIPARDARGERPRDGTLVLAMAIAPAAWFAHLLVGFALAPAICQGSSGRAAIGIISIIAVLAALGGLSLARRAWRQLPEGDDPVLRRGRFMALAGMLLSTLFTLIIVLASVPALVLKGCW